MTDKHVKGEYDVSTKKSEIYGSKEVEGKY